MQFQYTMKNSPISIYLLSKYKYLHSLSPGQHWSKNISEAISASLSYIFMTGYFAQYSSCHMSTADCVTYHNHKSMLITCKKHVHHMYIKFLSHGDSMYNDHTLAAHPQCQHPAIAFLKAFLYAIKQYRAVNIFRLK